VLADLLWDERSQSQAQSNLRTVLTILRRHFESYLQINRESVALNPQAAVWTDVGEFEARLEAARVGKTVGGQAESRRSLGHLYRGDFRKVTCAIAAALANGWWAAQRRTSRR
jgi:DNA-binding SARP family transcriptional activator